MNNYSSWSILQVDRPLTSTLFSFSIDKYVDDKEISSSLKAQLVPLDIKDQLLAMLQMLRQNMMTVMEDAELI